MLELRTGFERLMTHIARRECCCRAYKCDRVPTYGLPPLADTDDGPVDGTRKIGEVSGDLLHRARHDTPGSDHQNLGTGRAASADSYGRGERDAGGGGAAWSPTPAAEVPATFAGDHRGDDFPEEATVSSAPDDVGEEAEREEPGASGSQGRVKAAADRGDDHDGGGAENSTTARLEIEHDGFVKHEHQGVSFEGDRAAGESGGAMGRPRRNTVELLNAGMAIACREHALEGMVYLGQR